MQDAMEENGMPVTHEDMEFIEHRIYHDYVSTVDLDVKDPNHAEGSHE
jgi:hypothetical protein